MRHRPRAGVRAPVWTSLVALGCALGAGPAGAQGVQVALDPFEQSVTPGATFNVDMDVTQAGSPFNTFNAVVTFDPGVLTLLSHQEGCLMTGGCSVACGNTFHPFTAAGDSIVFTDGLLCSGISLTGPGQLYRLTFQAVSTPQVAFVRFRRAPTFYNAGLFVNPVSSTDCAIGIGVTLDAGSSAGPGELRVRAEPNPAAGAVSLTVASGTAGEQRLEVYDVSGRLVRTLASGWVAAGARRVPWDGRDAAGARAPAGIYLVHLSAGGRVVQARVVLLQ